MSDFDESKARRTASHSAPAKQRPAERGDARWIGQVLRRRYDVALTEELPASFLTLLEELDRKGAEKKSN